MFNGKKLECNNVLVVIIVPIPEEAGKSVQENVNTCLQQYPMTTL